MLWVSVGPTGRTCSSTHRDLDSFTTPSLGCPAGWPPGPRLTRSQPFLTDAGLCEAASSTPVVSQSSAEGSSSRNIPSLEAPGIISAREVCDEI